MKQEIYRKIFGVKYTATYTDNFRTIAICDKCIMNIEPPARVKDKADAGVGACDWCDAKNEMYRPKNALPSPSFSPIDWLIKNHPDYSDFADLPIDEVNLDDNNLLVLLDPNDETDDAVAVERCGEFSFQIKNADGTRHISRDEVIRCRARYLLKVKTNQGENLNAEIS